jgi:CBS domain-containing protein
MNDVFVGRLMSSPVETVRADTPVVEAGRTMLDEGIGSLVVVDGGGHLEGIVTATDFVHVVADQLAAGETTVGDVMSTEVVTTNANDDVRDVADLMLERDIHHVPVVDPTEGVVGMLSTTDLAAYLSRSVSPEQL